VDCQKWYKYYTNPSLSRILAVRTTADGTRLGNFFELMDWTNTPRESGIDVHEYAPDYLDRRDYYLVSTSANGEYEDGEGKLFSFEPSLEKVVNKVNSSPGSFPGDIASDINTHLEGEGGQSALVEVDLGIANPFALPLDNVLQIPVPDKVKKYLSAIVLAFCVIKLTQPNSSKVLWIPLTGGAGYWVYKKWK
jgi:hypothetical protein